MTVIHPKVRRIARERALQFLYGLDHTRYNWAEVLDDFWEHNPSRPTVRVYADKLIRGVCEQQEEIDREIEAALERWSPDRIGYVERGILRIAVFEMNHMSDVPAGVAINEAIEVAKRFGGDETPRFINGVLDRVRRVRGAADEDSEEGEDADVQREEEE